MGLLNWIILSHVIVLNFGSFCRLQCIWNETMLLGTRCSLPGDALSYSGSAFYLPLWFSTATIWSIWGLLCGLWNWIGGLEGWLYASAMSLFMSQCFIKRHLQILVACPEMVLFPALQLVVIKHAFFSFTVKPCSEKRMITWHDVLL